MKKEALAAEITGKKRRSNWLPKSLEQTAKDYGLIIIWGESDDLLEFRGAVYDEIGMYDGGHALLAMKKKGLGVISEDVIKEINLQLDDAGLDDLDLKSIRIDAKWHEEGPPSWTISTTDVPFAAFNIMDDDEEGEIFCIGIVIKAEDVYRKTGHVYSK